MRTRPLEIRLWEKIDKRGPDDCWPWRAYKSRDGYGRVQVGRRCLNAHRIAYSLIHGTLPVSLTIDHLCRNRACCNPRHMEPVPLRLNILRGFSPAADHAKQTHCIRGHEFTAENTKRQSNGGRSCRICGRLMDRLSYHRRKESRGV